MAHVNENYNKLPGNYLFQTIAKKVADYEKKTDRQVIRLGIGDVTKPLAPAIIEALHKAVDDMATAETFHGYGPEQGYDFLRHAIIKGDYETRGVSLDTDEVFIGDGAKTDVAWKFLATILPLQLPTLYIPYTSTLMLCSAIQEPLMKKRGVTTASSTYPARRKTALKLPRLLNLSTSFTCAIPAIRRAQPCRVRICRNGWITLIAIRSS